MNYRVFYECRTDNQVFSGVIEVDQPTPPLATDPALIELAIQDSNRFSRIGLAGIRIVEIIGECA